MTSIPANVQNYLNGGRAESSKAQTTEPKEDFGKVLNQQKTDQKTDANRKDSLRSSSSQKSTSDTEKEKSVEKTESTQPEKEETAVRQEQRETDSVTKNQKLQTVGANQTELDLATIQQTEEPSAEELEEIMEVLQSAIQQIQELLIHQLDLSPQQLERLMQDAGLTDDQLLQPNVVNQLILDAAGAEEPLALVMDEKLYTRQQTITQGCQEIMHDVEKQLDGREDKLPEVLESLQSNKPEQSVQQTYASAENGTTEDSRRQNGQDSSDTHSHNQNVTGQITYQNYTAQAQTVSQPVTSTMSEGTLQAYPETSDSQEITNQILDYMRVSMKPENTVLTMQLHPESLGTLHIQISAREGVMTAHFTASSETVKTVLENQMAALKESFLEQDIKVEAIEVTVETHQFESNLEQGRERNGEAADRKTGKRRRLDINSPESVEELTDEEQMIADMMAANGNSVDYLA